MWVQLLLVLFIQTPSVQTPSVETPSVETAPNPLELLYEDAMVAMEAEEWDEAISKLEAVLQEDPSHVGSRFNLAVAFDEAGQTDNALEAYRTLLAGDATVFEARMNLAILLNETGRPEDAIDEFAKAADLRPDDPVPALYRAQSLDQTNRTDETIAAYRRVLEIDPDLVEPHERLGFIYRDTNEGDQAVDELLAAERLGSTTPAVFVALGDIESERENLDAARTHYERADQLLPGDIDIGLRLALVLREQGEASGAIAILENLEEGPGGLDSILAEAYMENEMYAEAAEAFERLSRQNPETSDYWYMLGRAYLEIDMEDLAEAALHQAMSIDPKRLEGWGSLAAIYLSREDWQNAGITLLQYVTLEPDHADSHFGLALCYDNLGQFDQALVHYNRFMELDDGSDDARSFQVRQRAESLERYLNEN